MDHFIGKLLAQPTFSLKLLFPKERLAWKNMKGRCYNPNNPSYSYGGGKGVTVCDRWLNSFQAFLLDMGPAPTQSHSVDRINNDGNYEPGNCRWATNSEQQHNTTKCRWMTHAGKTMLATDWSNETGLSYSTITARIDRYGWSLADALTKPIRFKGRNKHSRKKKASPQD